MPTLTNIQLAALRQKMNRTAGTAHWTRGELNDAIQGIEDWIEANKAALSNAIDAATRFSFSPSQKRAMVAWYFWQKSVRELE